MALFAAFLFIAGYFREDPLPVSKKVLALLGASVLILNLLRWLYLRSGPNALLEGPLLSQTKHGVVQVSREAIEAGLRSAGEALPEVSRLRVRILTPTKRKILIRAHYTTPEGIDIFDLSARLRRTLLEGFERMVQLEREGKLEIELVFDGFYGKVKAPKAAPESKEKKAESQETESQPFTGPRYPIDLGEDA
ncbi:MAG TPA: hypothetical protein ENK02_06790 [Planctomycetes bacterium]|nr:hypothetical protein [Planctomycetota bacterium]